MKIAVNARWLLPGKLEGTGVYTLRMLEQLIPAFPQHEFHLLLDRSVDTEQLGLDFPNTTFHVVRPPARHPLLWTLWNDYALPLRLKKLQADLYWSPDGLPAKTDVKQWLTIHDLNFEHHPQWVPKPVAKYYRKHIRVGAFMADHVFTVSQWSKSDLVKTYGLSEEKVSVTYNAPQEAMSPGEMDTTAPYFCAVGALTPRKNLITLLKAFDLWCSQHPDQKHSLKIAGEAHFTDANLQREITALKHLDRIHWLGRLSAQALEKLYGRAAAYCMPSAMEGFGIPIIEAMQCGTAVIASNNSAITEVVGDAGLLVPTYSVEQWAKGLQEVLDRREELIKKGREHAKVFNWEKSVQPLITLIRSL